MTRMEKKTPAQGRRFLLRGARRSDRQILFLLARLQRVVEPARTLAAAGPGLFRIGRVTVLRRHDAAALARALGRAALAEHVVEREAFGLDQGVDLFTQLDDLVLAQFSLARLRLGDQVVELVMVEILDIDSHDYSRVMSH